MIDLVREGLGYTMLARMGFHRELKAGTVSLAHIVDPPILRTLVIATPKARPLSPATQFVIDSTTQLLQALIDAEPRRSEESHVGKECGSTARSAWSPEK